MSDSTIIFRSQKGGACLLRRGYEYLLREIDFNGVSSLSDDGRFRLIKDIRTKTLFILSLPAEHASHGRGDHHPPTPASHEPPSPTEKRFLVKVYKCQDFATQIKYLLRKSKAAKELLVAEEVRKRGIPGGYPVAAIDARRFGLLKECCLVIRLIESAQTLGEYLTKLKDAAARSEQTGPAKANAHSKLLRERREMIRRFAALVRRAHNAGIIQYDLGPENILVTHGAADFPETPAATEQQWSASQNKDDPLQIHLIDFEKLVIRRKLSDRQRMKNLAKLSRFDDVASNTDMLRFFHAYLEEGGVSSALSPSHFQRLVKMYAVERDKILRRTCLGKSRTCTSRKSKRNHTYFSTEKYHGYVRKEYEARLNDIISVLDSLPEPPDIGAAALSHEMLSAEIPPATPSRNLPELSGTETSPMSPTQNALQSRGNNSSSPSLENERRELPHANHERVDIVRFYRQASLKRRISDNYDALDGWRGAHGIALRHLPTPKPIAAIQRKTKAKTAGSDVRRRKIVESYFIAEGAPHALSLREFISSLQFPQSGVPSSDSLDQKRGLIASLASLMARIHSIGLYPRKLDIDKISLRRCEDQNLAPYLLVFDGLTITGISQGRRAIQNLASFASSVIAAVESEHGGHPTPVSHLDLCRFLKTYCRLNRKPGQDWRDVFRKVNRAARDRGT